MSPQFQSVKSKFPSTQSIYFSSLFTLPVLHGIKLKCRKTFMGLWDWCIWCCTKTRNASLLLLPREATEHFHVPHFPPGLMLLLFTAFGIYLYSFPQIKKLFCLLLLLQAVAGSPLNPPLNKTSKYLSSFSPVLLLFFNPLWFDGQFGPGGSHTNPVFPLWLIWDGGKRPPPSPSFTW